MNKIFAFNIEDNSEITSVNYEQINVLHLKRHDLPKVVGLKESSQPGVYILKGNGILYVGQSSKNVYSRLSKHENEKTWWTEAIIITDELDSMEKTMTEYMEKYIIGVLKNTSFLTLDNETKGNTSRVSPMTELQSQTMISKAFYVINNILKTDLIGEKYEGMKSNGESVSSAKVSLTDENENIFTASSHKKLLHEILKKYLSETFSMIYLDFYNEYSESENPNDVLKVGMLNDDEEKYWAISGDLYLNNKISNKKAVEFIDEFYERIGIDKDIKSL